MSTSPMPSHRLENVNERSRSPSPAAHPTNEQNSQQHAATRHARDNFLNPDNSDLHRTRRSVPTDSSIKGDTETAETIPLIDVKNINPPLADPDADDMGDDKEIADTLYPGVDDGFLFDRLGSDAPTIPGTENVPPPSNAGDEVNGGPMSRPMSPTQSNFYGFGRRFLNVENGTQLDLESIPDVNVYQHKKTLAQGMMDLALFSANANQLRYVMESDQHPFYYSGIILISFSLILQVAIGVGLIWNSLYNVKDEKQICIANKINNFTVIGIFLVTVVNVFICAFGVASVQTAVVATNP